MNFFDLTKKNTSSFLAKRWCASVFRPLCVLLFGSVLVLSSSIFVIVWMSLLWWLFLWTGSLGMIHCGVGAKTVRNFLSTLNIPCPTEKTLKRREREAGRFVEVAAKRSCLQAIREEKQLMEGKARALHQKITVPAANTKETCFECSTYLDGVVLRRCQHCARQYHHVSVWRWEWQAVQSLLPSPPPCA